MTQERKILKIISLLTLAWSLVAIVFDVIIITSAVGLGWDTENTLMVLYTSFVALFSFYTGVRGAQGANVPSRVGSYTATSLILLLCIAVFLILSVLVNMQLEFSGIGQELPYLLFIVAGLILNGIGWLYGRKIYNDELNK